MLDDIPAHAHVERRVGEPGLLELAAHHDVSAQRLVRRGRGVWRHLHAPDLVASCRRFHQELAMSAPDFQERPATGTGVPGNLIQIHPRGLPFDAGHAQGSVGVRSPEEIGRRIYSGQGLRAGLGVQELQTARLTALQAIALHHEPVNEVAAVAGQGQAEADTTWATVPVWSCFQGIWKVVMPPG